MKKPRRPQTPNWTRIVAIGIILAIVGYQWYQNNRSATLTSGNESDSVAQNDAGSNSKGDKYRVKKLEPKSTSWKDADDSSERLNSTKIETSSRANSSNSTSRAESSKSVSGTNRKSNDDSNRATSDSGTNESDSFLQPAGGKNLRSPAGLIYGMAASGEHRVDHVMRHAKDDRNRPSHGVFDGDQETILQAIDEAYELVKSKSKYVQTESSQGNTAYTVSLGRRIGYEGGEKGQRSNNKPLKSIRLILDGERLITAYPYR